MVKVIGIGYGTKGQLMSLMLNLKLVNSHKVLNKIVELTQDLFNSNDNLSEAFNNQNKCLPFLISLEHLDGDKDFKDNYGHLGFLFNTQTDLQTQKIMEAIQTQHFDFLKNNLIKSLIKNGKYQTIFDNTYQEITDINNFKNVYTFDKGVDY